MKYYILNELNRSENRGEDFNNIQRFAFQVPKILGFPLNLLYLRIIFYILPELDRPLLLLYPLIAILIVVFSLSAYFDKIRKNFINGLYSHVPKNTLKGKIQFWMYFLIPFSSFFISNDIVTNILTEILFWFDIEFDSLVNKTIYTDTPSFEVFGK